MASDVNTMAASNVGSLASSSIPSVAYIAAAMMANIADGPSCTSAIAGSVDRNATAAAPTTPL